jgi:hypothetical protein
MREQERRRLIKEHLDLQVNEKMRRRQAEKQQADMYEAHQQNHLDLLLDREKERNDEHRNKAINEKMSREN